MKEVFVLLTDYTNFVGCYESEEIANAYLSHYNDVSPGNYSVVKTFIYDFKPC